jgi:hypothetical protein
MKILIQMTICVTKLLANILGFTVAIRRLMGLVFADDNYCLR